jgi:hypothetical protein
MYFHFTHTLHPSLFPGPIALPKHMFVVVSNKLHCSSDYQHISKCYKKDLKVVGLLSKGCYAMNVWVSDRS